jgi:hypothetical protein
MIVPYNYMINIYDNDLYYGRCKKAKTEMQPIGSNERDILLALKY